MFMDQFLVENAENNPKTMFFPPKSGKVRTRKIIVIGRTAVKWPFSRKKTVIARNGHFDIWWLLEPKILTLGQIWWENVTGAAQELSIAFRFLSSCYKSRDIGWFSWEETIILQNLTFDDLWWPYYWRERKKWLKWVRTISLRAFDCFFSASF